MDIDQVNHSNLSTPTFSRNTKHPLTNEDIDTFVRDGVLVLPGILNPSQIQEAREGLARTLLHHGVDVNNLHDTAKNVTSLSTTNGSGGVLDIFYPKWKMDIATNESLFHATSQLWKAAYTKKLNFTPSDDDETCNSSDSLPATNNHMHDIDNAVNLDMSDKCERVGGDLNHNFDCFRHPYGDFPYDKGFVYIDRICYRLPTSVAEESGKGFEGSNVVKHNTIMNTIDSKDSNTRGQNEKKMSPLKQKKNRSTRPIQRCLTVGKIIHIFSSTKIYCCPFTIYNPIHLFFCSRT